MERGGKGKLEQEVMNWLGSGSKRTTAIAFHSLGMEASENSRGASHFRARRYVKNHLQFEGLFSRKINSPLCVFARLKTDSEKHKIAKSQYQLFSRESDYLKFF